MLEKYDDVFAISGSTRPYYVVGNEKYSEIDEGFPISRDDVERDLGARRVVPSRLTELDFRVAHILGESAADVRCQADALMIARGGVEPRFDIAGVTTIVSQRAKDALSPHVADECEFPEASVRGMYGRWFFLWVKKILDPVDYEKSDLRVVRWGADGGAVYRPNRLVFDQERVNSSYLFRLPQWLFQWDKDLCTGRLVELIRRCKLKGFVLTSDAGTGRFLGTRQSAR